MDTQQQDRPSVAEALVHTADAVDRERARQHYRDAVTRTGRWPSAAARPRPRTSTDETEPRQTELEWAFEGHEEELDELAQRIREAQAERTEREQRAAKRGELRDATRAVLREWEQAEEAERYRKAEAEAKKRLGWDE